MTRPAVLRTVPAIAAMALAVAAHAADGSAGRGYTIDPARTRVVFEIDQGESTVTGTVAGSEGSLWFDERDWSSAKLDVVVPMERIDMGDAGMLAAVFAPRFLDVKRFPQARFVSRQVTRDSGNRGSVCGDLTLHGVTRPLCMALVLDRVARQSRPPFRRKVGFSASATLRRSDFGMTAWESLVGDTVALRIEAECVRRAGDAANEAVAGDAAIDEAAHL
jgi:polyisoprenoid-binding protein YceI